jgi:tetratricopeptide (TPR) repeat protein
MNESNGTEREKEPKRFSRSIIWVGLVVLVLVAVIVGGYFFIRSNEIRHLEDARTAISLSDWETATLSLEQALNTQPAFIRQHVNEAIALRGFSAYQMGNLSTALDDFDQVLVNDNDLIDLLAYRANIHFVQDNQDMSSNDGEAAMKNSELLPDHLLAKLHANQAIINDLSGDDQAVLAEIEAALVLSQHLKDETLAELYARRASRAYRLGDFDTASEDIRFALSFDVILPDELLATILANQAELLYEREQYERVMDASDHALEYENFLPDETLTDLYLKRAQILYQEGELGAAIGEAQQAASYGEDLALPHALMALQSYLSFEEKQAMDEAEAALTLDDQDALAHRIRGTLLAWQGDAQNALKHLEKSLALEPNDLETLTMSVYVQLELNDLEAAEADLARAIDLDPNNPATIWAKAMVHEHNYEFKTARTLLDQAIAKDENRPEFYTLRSHTYRLTEEMEDANVDLERALELNPEFADARTGIVGIRANGFDFENFETDIQELLSRYPTWHRGHQMLAEYHLWVTGDLDQVAIHVEKVHELSPDASKGHVLQGFLYLEQDEFEQALASFELARELNSDSTDALGGLVDYYLAEQEFDEALAIVEDIRTIDQESMFPRVGQAQVYLAKGDLQSAWSVINRVLDADAQNPTALLIRAEINQQAGNIQEAMIDISRALDNYPLYADALLKRADIYYLQGDLDSARQYANQALEVDPNLSFAHGLLSDIAFSENDLEESLKQTSLVIEKRPDLAYWYYDQGFINTSLGRFDEAVASYSTGLEVETEDDGLIGLLTFSRALAYYTLGDKEQSMADFQAVLENTTDVELLSETENLLAYPSAIPVVTDGRFLIEDEVQRFAISYSPDWERLGGDPENGYVLSLWAEQDDQMASVDVYLLEWPLGVSLLAQATLEALFEPGSVNSLSLDSMEIAGTNGLVRQYEFFLEDGTLASGRHYYAVQGGRAVIIVVEVTEGDFDQFAEEIQLITSSFEFLP